MSFALNAIQQDQKVSRAPVICSMGMLGTQLMTAYKKTLPDLFQTLEFDFVLSKGISRRLTSQ